MKGKRFLVAILLAVSFCFVSRAGYGIIPRDLVIGKVNAWAEQKASLLDYFLLEARVNYMMRNFSGYDWVWMEYDMTDRLKDFFKLPNDVDTADKIVVVIEDQRGELPRLLPIAKLSLLEAFERKLTIICGYIQGQFPIDMNDDIVAILKSKEEINLAYFHQGEYHLCGE